MQFLKLPWIALLWILFGCSSGDFAAGTAARRAGDAHADGPSVDKSAKGGKDSGPADGDDSGNGGLDASDGGDAGDAGLDDHSNTKEDDGDYGTATDPKTEIDDEGNAVVRFKSKGVGMADIAFFVDTSGSMTEEIGLLQTELGDFVERLADKDLDIDAQVFVVGGANDNNITLPSSVTSLKNVEHVPRAVDSEDGLARARDFLAGLTVPKKLELREESIKELIFVTDDDGKVMGSSGFSSFLAGRDDEVHVNGIVGMNEGDGVSCDIAEVGSEYQRLAAMSAHKGLIQDLCDRDWDKLLKAISESVKDHVTFKFKLEIEPSEPEQIVVYVDGKKLGDSDFRYDEDKQTIVIDKDKAPKSGQKVKIIYPSAE